MTLWGGRDTSGLYTRCACRGQMYRAHPSGERAIIPPNLILAACQEGEQTAGGGAGESQDDARDEGENDDRRRRQRD
jgi:hypothetical protein